MYKTLVRPFLNRLDHETGQHIAREILHTAESNPLTLSLVEYLSNKGKRFTHSMLSTTIAGIPLDNPLMLAAGWDKLGRSIRGLHSLGFSAIEVGTVTAYAQPGNFKPRLYAIGEGVSLNSYGFPSPGMEVVAKNLERYRNDNIPIGINIGKNKYIPLEGMPYMHAVVVRRLYPYATYFTLGISSPNTPGIKNLQKKKYLRENVREIHLMMEEIGFRKPLFIKVAPEIDESTLDGVLEVIFEENLAGIIAVNTYTQKNILAKYGAYWEERPGGIGGNDIKYRNLATQKIAQIYTKTQGKIPIIGTGGVRDISSALEKIAAGATALQLLTGLFFEGPSLPGKINRGLVKFMEKENIKSLGEIRGINAQKILDKNENYSFNINVSVRSLEQLKAEYLHMVFSQEKYNTLFITKKQFQLKHGELGRTSSHIYLNHRIPLFNHNEHKNLFAKILETLILEKFPESSNYGFVSIPSSSSPELTSILQERTGRGKTIVFPREFIDAEKGTKTRIYGSLRTNMQWILVDDVFTSGKTMKDAITILTKNSDISLRKVKSVSLVARNEYAISQFGKQTKTDHANFLTLDEILQFHWRNFSNMQKRLVKKERVLLQ